MEILSVATILDQVGVFNDIGGVFNDIDKPWSQDLHAHHHPDCLHHHDLVHQGHVRMLQDLLPGAEIANPDQALAQAPVQVLARNPIQVRNCIKKPLIILAVS